MIPILIIAGCVLLWCGIVFRYHYKQGEKAFPLPEREDDHVRPDKA
jgi:hypothetical protein